MKKKIYVTPQIRYVQMRKTHALCNSPLSMPYRITSNRRGMLLEMEYGGINLDEDMDPD